MESLNHNLKKGYQISAKGLFFWRIAQYAVWLIGFGILFCLVFYPAIGVLLFWNILIPVAPLLLVLAPGIWRNVCPLATTNLLPRHLNLSKRKKLTVKQHGIISLIAVILLFLIVPLRHVLFNENGIATAILITIMAITGVIAGFFYEWKSVWCSGLCPIHPVEKLYGENVLFSVPNAHCKNCMKCVVPCPDSTPNIIPASNTRTDNFKMSSALITGGLPGFIWGWFHVPDSNGQLTFESLGQAYYLPVLGFLFSFSIYMILQFLLMEANSIGTKKKYNRYIAALFAASAVSCYYWYRIPSLFGYGLFRSDGVLINLYHQVNPLIFTFITLTTSVFFFYWLLVRKPNKKSWLMRPEYASKISNKTAEAIV